MSEEMVDLEFREDPLLTEDKRGTTIQMNGERAKIRAQSPEMMERLIDHPSFTVTQLLCVQQKETAKHTYYVESMDAAQSYDGVYRLEGTIPTACIEITE